jgi:hypothetical protein
MMRLQFATQQARTDPSVGESVCRTRSIVRVYAYIVRVRAYGKAHACEVMRTTQYPTRYIS